MLHKEPVYIRKGRTIKNVKTGVVEEFSSISAAKLHSRVLQQANGGRGQGYVRVQRKGN